MLKAEEIIAEYRRTESVKATAKVCGCSVGAVVKHLVSAGMYSTPISDRITELYCQGRSAKEIEAELHVSHSTVSKYLPYVKGTYLAPLDQKSPNARRIIKHRQKRKEKADD